MEFVSPLAPHAVCSYSALAFVECSVAERDESVKGNRPVLDRRRHQRSARARVNRAEAGPFRPPAVKLDVPAEDGCCWATPAPARPTCSSPPAPQPANAANACATSPPPAWSTTHRSRRPPGPLTRRPLLIYELGYPHLDERGAELLFQVITEREERASIAVATNSPFSEWNRTFTDPRLCAAVIDRLTFNAHIIETGTASYRLRSSTTR